MTHDEVFDMTQQLINQRIYERNHSMKTEKITYEVELQRVTYITYLVEATNEDDAQELAFDRAIDEHGRANYYATYVKETT